MVGFLFSLSFFLFLKKIADLFRSLFFRFKSNPNLVSGFEAPKLPRPFLVLLENLLDKTSSF